MSGLVWCPQPDSMEWIATVFDAVSGRVQA